MREEIRATSVPPELFLYLFPLDWYRLASAPRCHKADLSARLKALYIYFNNDAEAFAVKNAVYQGGEVDK